MVPTLWTTRLSALFLNRANDHNHLIKKYATMDSFAIEVFRLIFFKTTITPCQKFLFVDHFSENKVADSVQTAQIDHSVKPNKTPEIWWFSAEERTLANPGKKISLTGIESLLL